MARIEAYYVPCSYNLVWSCFTHCGHHDSLGKVIDDTYAIVNKCLTNEIKNITHVGAMHMSFTQSIT